MKRSEINAIIKEANDFFYQQTFFLPEWAYWSPEQWKGIDKSGAEIIENQLGWDITDFGSGDYNKKGLVLFTIRNGKPGDMKKVYCEKIMVADENQETPMHFHWNKTEDIINRGGGILAMELYNASEDGQLLDTEVKVKIDGIEKSMAPGEELLLQPGQSICLVPYLYHRFYGKEGHGKVLIGEVSTVNDDANDNRFYDEIGRFPEIVEDESPYRLLVSDYEKFI